MVNSVCGGGEWGKYVYIYVCIVYYESLLSISEVLVDMVLFEKDILLKLDFEVLKTNVRSRIYLPSDQEANS